jgi:hypothetical protein
MSDLYPTIDELDQDGALREAADKVDGHTRAAFMRRTGAFIGTGLVAGLMPVSFASAAVAKSDVAILNYALTLEFLEAAFYKEAVAKGALSGETATFAKVVADHEAQHVAALKKALGSAATKSPSFNFKGTTGAQGTFQQTAIVLEDTGVSAYLGQVGNIKNKDILAAAGSILPVEAWHASWIREIAGQTPAPNAFEPAATMATVLTAVKGTGFVTSTIAAPAGAPVNGTPTTAG